MKIKLNNEKDNLKNVLKKICDELRTVMEVNEYRNYVLGFLFYKYLSEKIEKKANSFLQQKNINYQYLDLANSDHKEYVIFLVSDIVGFFLEYKYTFQNVVKEIDKGKKPIEFVKKAFDQIKFSTQGKAYEEDFKGLFTEISLDEEKLGKIQNERENIIAFIMKEFSKLNLYFDDSHNNILEDTYEYFLSKFAYDGGKKSGEFYTPIHVAELIVNIASHGRENSINTAYDPSCGSGSLLLRLFKKTKNCNMVYGQEIMSSTVNLAKMNFFLREMNFSNFNIRKGDTLINPQHLKENKFECIVAHPPFGLSWNPTDGTRFDRRYECFSAIAPKNRADLAFLQHMLYHVDTNNGIIVSIFSLGVLERQGPEYKIRKDIVNFNWIDAIIVLPSRIFASTSIPSCIIVARKNKKENTDILFVDGTNEFEVDKRQNFLSEQNIQKIYQAWVERKDIVHFSRVVPLREIQENDYSLSIWKYIETIGDEQEDVDIDKVNSEFARINKEIKELEAKFEKNLAIFNKND